MCIETQSVTDQFSTDHDMLDEQFAAGQGDLMKFKKVTLVAQQMRIANPMN